MSSNPLTVLRLALPGQPSSRDLAKKIGCSHALLHKFERGDLGMGVALVAKYAKAVNSTPEEVRVRWLHAALEANRRRRLELQDELRKMGVKDPRMRRGRKSA